MGSQGQGWPLPGEVASDCDTPAILWDVLARLQREQPAAFPFLTVHVPHRSCQACVIVCICRGVS